MQPMSLRVSLGSFLRRHLKTHSGEKTYKCNHCDFVAVWANSLKRHLKTHSGEVWVAQGLLGGDHQADEVKVPAFPRVTALQPKREMPALSPDMGRQAPGTQMCKVEKAESGPEEEQPKPQPKPKGERNDNILSRKHEPSTFATIYLTRPKMAFNSST